MILPREELARRENRYRKMEDVLKYIVSGQIYADVPSGDADFSELGRDIYPVRMGKIVDMAKGVLNT